ncbi:related to amino-acid permease 2 [Melanopsichium pennsylvanicum]|uniref:Related to amino-acid permease 2 n=2 Tax=Melanopsichium pennsylvanicum TaxID=63383 RepID=A0AAJ4XNB9_9BASI|nr:related to amino-acid permease 2 [Melanopsichium pennsylvanicum 4]SNX85504.1 related to amino-acid permease 2 [Melanopsichium pennsylvanicum]
MPSSISSNSSGGVKAEKVPVIGANEHDARVSHQTADLLVDEDDAMLAARMGHKSEFAREFKSFSTISYAFAIMGLVSSVATTFNSPFTLGGPAATVWTWFMGSCFNMTLGLSIAELVSAYPSAGGLYSASGLLVPRKQRAFVAWLTGWLNFTGQIAGIAGTEYGLSQMIFAWAYVITKGRYVATTGATVGLYIALLALHGVINCFGIKTLARLTSSYVIVNLGITFIIIIVVLAKTPLDQMHSAAYTFTTLDNQSGWSSSGLAFFFGLYCVQFVMTDYDATAHISEEVSRAAIAAPVAIVVAVAGTGAVGWVLNIVMVLVSGDVGSTDISTWPGGLAFAQILYLRAGRVGFLIIWPFVCSVAFFVVTTALQANARSFYAFSRDNALPDRGFFARINKRTGTTVNAVWLVVFPCMALGCLAFASYTAVTAIFALAALGMDSSYLVPIVARWIYWDHPDVQFKPGPFTLGRGLLGKTINGIAICWTMFECVVLAIPTVKPISAINFNYSWVIMMGILLLASIWFVSYAHKHYQGPRSTLTPEQQQSLGVVSRDEEGVHHH